MFFYQPSGAPGGGGAKVNKSQISKWEFFILISDFDSLQKSITANWVSFFYIVGVSTSKLDKTANF